MRNTAIHLAAADRPSDRPTYRPFTATAAVASHSVSRHSISQMDRKEEAENAMT